RLPAPARVEQLLEVAAYTFAQRLQGGGSRGRLVLLLGGIGVDQPMQQRQLGAPRRSATTAIPAETAVDVAKVAHSATRQVREPIPSPVFGASPTTRVPAPTPRVGPLSPTCTQSVARPSRRASVGSGAPARRGG